MAAVPRARSPCSSSSRRASTRPRERRAGAGRVLGGARPRRADRARVRARDGLRLHDDRADPDRGRDERARDRAPPRGVRLGLARADARCRGPPPARSSSARARRSPTSSGSSRAARGGIGIDVVGTFAAAPGRGGSAVRSSGSRRCSSASVRTSSCSPRPTSTSRRCSASSSSHTGTGVKVKLAPTHDRAPRPRGRVRARRGRAAVRAAPAAAHGASRGRRSARSTSSSRRSARRRRHARSGSLLAAAIKLDSRGPVLYVDRRIGVGEREFGMLKFRTMVADAAELPARARGARTRPRARCSRSGTTRA